MCRRWSRRPAAGTRFFDRELPGYLDHLAVERGLSAATVPAYRADLVEALVRAVGRYLEASQADRRSTPPLPPPQGAVRSNPGSPNPP